jgi:hypothetical protein
MATGAIALEKLQAGLESTRGTAVPATRKVYGQRGGAWWNPTISKQFLEEGMSSYIKNYRHVVTETGATLVVPFALTAADFAWYGQQFFAGGVAGVLANIAAYRYVFSQSAGTGGGVTADNLKTTTFEAYSDTQGYQFPFCLADKLEITWQRGQIVNCQATYIAQQATPQAITAAITDRTGLNAIAGAGVTVAIDNAGGTMGTTVYSNVLDGKLTLDNGWETLIHNVGKLYFDDAYRPPRSISLELNIHEKDTVEYAHLNDDAERLIQVSFTGPLIAGCTPPTNESVVFGLYGFYTSGAFSAGKTIRTVKLGGETQFDTSAGFDWNCTVTNALPTLV